MLSSEYAMRARNVPMRIARRMRFILKRETPPRENLRRGLGCARLRRAGLVTGVIPSCCRLAGPIRDGSAVGVAGCSVCIRAGGVSAFVTMPLSVACDTRRHVCTSDAAAGVTAGAAAAAAADGAAAAADGVAVRAAVAVIRWVTGMGALTLERHTVRTIIIDTVHANLEVVFGHIRRRTSIVGLPAACAAHLMRGKVTDILAAISTDLLGFHRPRAAGAAG